MNTIPAFIATAPLLAGGCNIDRGPHNAIIVRVMSEQFRIPSGTDVWTPQPAGQTP